jgi:putative flavoprotein involved in K+ transport
VTSHRGASIIVVGAGPPGLPVAGALAQRGVHATIVEQSEQVGASWRARYDRLRLNTSRWLSHLPGLRFPLSDGRFPRRDAVAAYVERYARTFQLDIQHGERIRAVNRSSDGRWQLDTSRGVRDAQSVIIATGRDHTPVIPDWPGRQDFTGEMLHAADYRNPVRFQDRRVLVVGAGNSGAEIALDLAEGGAAEVKLAIGTPPHIVPRAIAGIPNDLFSVFMQHQPVRLVDASADVIAESSSVTSRANHVCLQVLEDRR